MIAKLPAMDDKALAVLRANAERLGQKGTKAQMAAAAALLPAIDAEVEVRKAAKLSKAKETRAANAATAKSRVKAAAATEATAD